MTATRTLRARPLVSRVHPADVLSLLRVPLAVLFPFALGSGHRIWPLAVIAAAALSDVLDGWVARRSGAATAAGAVIDAVADKIFFVTVVAALLVAGLFTPIEVALLFTRELGEVPLAVFFLLRGDRAAWPAANAFGKATTVLQLGAAVSAIVGIAHLYLAFAACTFGVLSVVSHWLGALARSRRA